MGLWADFLVNDRRVIHKWKHYFPVYERHFRHYVNRPVIFLEIGIGEGGSLQMWKRYFGPHARIIGIDVNHDCLSFAEDQIEIRIGRQEDPGFLGGIIEEFGAPDIVLDDGSHVMAHISATFKFLYPRTATNGVYMVEDLHTAYWSEFGGGYRHPDSFIEACKGMIDELNADLARDAPPATEFTRTTLSMHFYNGMVVFERGRHTAKLAPTTGHREQKRKHVFRK